ncbi:MAG: response regulator [Methanomicrobiales archaeon]|nr:response regulator [Methanomicrobiales archaeon]
MVFKVMVVDDDLPTLEVMNLILKKIGYEPVLYRNGLDALQWLEQHCPDLILLDLQMIPIDGWEFLRRLREDRSRSTIPVMLFTARPLLDQERAHADREVVKVLEKPVAPNELKQELEEFFRKLGRM